MLSFEFWLTSQIRGTGGLKLTEQFQLGFCKSGSCVAIQLPNAHGASIFLAQLVEKVIHMTALEIV